MIDTSGKGIHLTDVKDGVYFDLLGDGNKLKTAWTARDTDNAWLVLDRNGNGIIDSGKEMFGSMTDQPDGPDRNGFKALAVFDEPANGGNNDGLIDSRDAVYSKLRLWIDSNHDGYSQPEELHTLPALGIERIDLLYQTRWRRDEYGNMFRYRARIWDNKGSRGGRWAWDVFLQTNAK